MIQKKRRISMFPFKFPAASFQVVIRDACALQSVFLVTGMAHGLRIINQTKEAAEHE